MALSNAQFADAFAAQVSDFHTGTITQAEFETQFLASLNDWAGLSVSNAVLAQRIISLIGGLEGVIFTDGPPDPEVGEVGSLAFDVTNKAFYGLKTASGWGAPDFVIEGPQGDPGADGADGEDGREVELQTNATHIQWRYVGDPAWTDLVLLDSLADDGADGADGADGREIELQTSATHFQWRYVGDAGWTDLYPLPQDGADGADGTDGTFQNAWRGTWDAGTAYAQGDIVRLNGQTWYADAASTGVSPTEVSAEWSLLAAKGADGGGSGTVTSVAASGSGGISVTGSPITDSGTLAITTDPASLPIGNATQAALDDKIESFIGAPDTPASYADSAGKAAIVNATNDGLIFADLDGSIPSLYIVTHPDYGATGDGATDDTAAIQAAIDAASAAGGGTVYLPSAAVEYKTSDVLLMDHANVRLVGAGGINFNNTAPPTTIRATHTDGPVIRIGKMACGVSMLRIDSDATRAAAAAGSNYGIWCEPLADTGSGAERTSHLRFDQVHIRQQPNDGLILVGQVVGTLLTQCRSDQNGGHGYCIDRGKRTGRTNEVEPGIVTFINCRAEENGGHALAAGNPDDVAGELPCYRIVLDNFECFENCHDAAVRYSNFQVFLYGENCEVRNSGFGGANVDGTPESHGGIEICGGMNRLVANRYISTNQPVFVNKRTAIPTVDVLVDGLKLVNSSIVHNTAVLAAAGCDGVRVRINGQSSDYTNAASKDRESADVQADDSHIFRGNLNVGSLASGDNRVITDDSVTAFEFNGTAYGLVMLSSNASASPAMLLHFRVGTFGFINAVGSTPSGVTLTTGALTGTTGVDGDITISVHTDNKLYIENRSGVQVSYQPAFFCLAPASARLLPDQ